MTLPNKEVSPQASAYAEAVESAQLRNIRLIKSTFEAEPEGLSSDRSAWKQGYGCVVSSTHYDSARKIMSGLVTAEAFCKLGRRKVISLKCNYVVAYEVEGDPEETALVQFVERVSTFAVYPYFRAHFAEMTSQAGIALRPLPVMKEARRIVPRQKA